MLHLSFDMLRAAIDAFLRCAYPNGQVPAAVRQRAELDHTRPINELLSAPSFERYASEVPFPCTVLALRLGSSDYPHLKLEIRPFPSQCGFVFWVNTHDYFFAPGERYGDFERWQQITRRNGTLKQEIERSWAEQQLPTYAAALRETLQDAPPGAVSPQSPALAGPCDAPGAPNA